jgi:hypothetical protein
MYIARSVAGWYLLMMDVGAEVRADFSGHQIVAASFGTDDNRLYIDGKLVDSSKYRSTKVAFLRGVVIEEERKHIVEVIHRGKWTSKRLCILVDGTEVSQSKIF